MSEIPPPKAKVDLFFLYQFLPLTRAPPPKKKKNNNPKTTNKTQQHNNIIYKFTILPGFIVSFLV